MAVQYISTDPTAGVALGPGVVTPGISPSLNLPYTTIANPAPGMGSAAFNANTPGVTPSGSGYAVSVNPTTGAPITNLAAPSTSAGNATAGGAVTQPTVTDPHDPAQITAWLQWLATQPNTDPILQTPGGIAYYEGVIANNPDGLTPQNTAYWQGKATLASAGGSVGAGGGGGGGGLTPQGSGSIDSLGFNQPFNAPTAQDAANTPGYQFMFQQGQQALENSQFARGVGLTGGAAKALVDYGEGVASTNYQQTYANALNQYLDSYNIFSGNLNSSVARNQFQQTTGANAAAATTA